MNAEERKAEVEKMLGFTISNKQFRQAYKRARDKLNYIEQREGLHFPEMKNWYLTKLTEECMRSIVVENFTKDLCRRGYKKECQAEA